MLISVKRIFEQVNSFIPKKIQLYIKGLVLCEGKKTCTKLGEEMGVSHDKINRCLQSKLTYEDQQFFLINLIKDLELDNSESYLIGDDTCLRHYSKIMEGVGLMYSSIDKIIVRGHSLVVLCWSNGKITIPIAWDIYIPKGENELKAPRTKIQILQSLITQVQLKIKFTNILLDGLYQSENMMVFLDDFNINFTMRLPKNRTIQHIENTKAIKIKNNRHFKLQRNTRSYSWKAILHNKKRYIAAEKRKNPQGDYETVYLVSNFDAHTKEYLKRYLLRWSIEQLFRTSKQSLGLGDCQARALSKQKIHIFSVFSAFAIAELIKLSANLKNTPDSVRLHRAIILRHSYSMNM